MAKHSYKVVFDNTGDVYKFVNGLKALRFIYEHGFEYAGIHEEEAHWLFTRGEYDKREYVTLEYSAVPANECGGRD